MELTVREVAALLGRHPRTIRAQIASGRLPAVKRGGQWRIPRRGLPLTETEHRALQAKAETVRDAVEAALPGRVVRTAGDRARSVTDLRVFREGVTLLHWVRDDPDVLPPAVLAAVDGALSEGLAALAEMVHQYERSRKLDALSRARAALSRAAALLLVEGGVPPSDPVRGWVATLEGALLPALGSLARRVDRRRGPR